EDFSAYDYDIRNYPNPFNNQTTIEFSLTQRGHVTIKIYNLLGQEICSLVNSEQAPGKYKLVWNSEDYSVGSGLYFIELKVGKMRKLIKCMMLK
ncbi:MAG: T9SS type A sorting domain-containing protein, partial [candidate division KSB1 bacterium]|nr:T9SS type A sorting domain-containing protein [candidate division KSB1 bacterium]